MGSANVKLNRRQVLGIAAGGVAGAVGFRYLTLQIPGASQQVASAAGSAGAWASPLSTSSGRAAHLLRRATFGYTSAQLDAAASMAYPDLVDMVINQAPEALPAVDRPTDYQTVVRAWYQHMATTPAQFPERMALFWHGLLTSDYRKAARLPFVLQQNELYRTVGRSDFRTLINAVTYDPLMIRYLDLEESTRLPQRELQPRAHGAVHARRRHLHGERCARGRSRVLRDSHRARRRERPAHAVTQAQGLDAGGIRAGD